MLGIGLLYLARTLVGWLPADEVLVTPLSTLVSVVGSFLMWTTVPWLLLDRRVAWRRLVPDGALAAACATSTGSRRRIYMPRLLETYSGRYGLFGVTLALVGWLVGLTLILVATTAVGSELDRTDAPWARRLRRALRDRACRAPAGCRAAGVDGPHRAAAGGTRAGGARALGVTPGPAHAGVAAWVGVRPDDGWPAPACGRRRRRRPWRTVHVRRSAGDERAAVVAAALAPYAWRDLTDRMLARRVVGAADRHAVAVLLASVPGTEVGEAAPIEPADAADERVDALLRALAGVRWRAWSLARLCRDLVAGLETWQAERESLESDLRRLLEGH